jgi:hypothetical protein
VTDDKSLPNQLRKDKQIAAASHKSDGASVIKLADKTSNLLAIAKSPPPWPTDRKRAYVEWAIWQACRPSRHLAEGAG